LMGSEWDQSLDGVRVLDKTRVLDRVIMWMGPLDGFKYGRGCYWLSGATGRLRALHLLYKLVWTVLPF